MEFVAFLGTDKENWGQISALMKRLVGYEKIILIKNKYAEPFPLTERCSLIEIDSTKSLIEIKNELHEKLKKELSKEFEVTLSLVSGSGKEHMALIGALLAIPVGIRLVAYTKNGVEFLT